MSGTDSSPGSIEHAIRIGADELHVLQTRLTKVERQIETIFSRSHSNLTSEEIASLQDMDLIVQSIAALQGYFDRLSDETIASPTPRIPIAISSIPIGELRDRFLGLQKKQVSRGLPELF